MGRDYLRWFIPKGNTFCPSGAAITQLVERLRKEHWIADPSSESFRHLRFDGAPLAAKAGAFAKHATPVTSPRNPAAGWEALPLALTGAWIDAPTRSDLVLRFPLHADAALTWGAASVRYPLTRSSDSPKPLSCDIEIHRAEDFVYPISEQIDPIDAECACGEDLEFEWDDDEFHSPFGATTGIFAECSDCSKTFDPSGVEAVVRDPYSGKSRSVRGGAAYRFALVVHCGKCFPEGGPMPEFDAELKTLVEAEFGREFYEIGAVE